MKKNSTNELSERLLQFAVNVILYLRTVKYSVETIDIKRQLTKSCTSAGANYEESQGAYTKPDARMKIGISLKEMRESNYFLKVADQLNHGDNGKCNTLIKESTELKLILASILNKLNNILILVPGSWFLGLGVLNFPPC
ncbi:MAG: four helix bundle protein [Flavobacteriales bacterium]|nr:four helix bundle protein [Flavobacteriales bacterium]PCH85550.1 MAG: four helix bundle protein [Flavobacteriales bacterium]